VRSWFGERRARSGVALKYRLSRHLATRPSVNEGKMAAGFNSPTRRPNHFGARTAKQPREDFLFEELHRGRRCVVPQKSAGEKLLRDIIEPSKVAR
jgi:hypothetical protein